MNKTFYILIILPLFGFCQNTAIDKTTAWQKENLSGKVKQMTETWFGAIQEEGKWVADKEKPNNGSHIVRFDKKGNYIETKRYYRDAFTSTKTIELYNDKGQLINYKRYTKDTLLSENTYKYDVRGQLIETSGYKADGSLINKIKTKYDEKGNRSESRSFDAENYKINGKYIKIPNPDTNRVSRTVYKYDEKGIETESSFYNEGDTLVMQHIFMYKIGKQTTWTKNINYLNTNRKPTTSIDSTILDKKGNILKNYNYKDKEGNITLMTLDSNLYDKKGRALEMNKVTYCCFESSMGLSQTRFKYDKNSIEEIQVKKGNLNKQITVKDKNGRILETSKYNKNGELEGRNTNKYDEQGNVIETTTWRKESKRSKEFNSAVKFLYEYDKKRNWIKKTQWYATPGKGMVYEREIEYY